MSKLIFTLALLLLQVFAFGQNRNNDPVVIKGSDLKSFIGVSPSRIVAYKFNGSGLVQIPLQVDEVVVKEASAPYKDYGCAFGTISNNIAYDNISFYADTSTFTGADTNALFDADDELVFMAKDAGPKLNICPSRPPGCVSDTTCEIALRDPLNNAIVGYIYLFRQNGSLNQGAGVNYVNYNFTFANNYKQAYDICTGGVTENSTVTTANYSMRFTKRWIEDELKIAAGGASNVDILDRHQAFVYPNNCFRSEQTFSDSRGTVVTSKNGPVRAIRSVMGANSGVGTQITNKFTESRVDYQVDFRVHPIGGFYDVYDLNTNAIGMMYYNNQNPNGVLINGVQDSIVAQTPNMWELYTGNQGSIAVSYAYQTDIPLGSNSFVEAYYDDGGTTNPKHSCTGDGFAYGSSGFHLATGLCTDYWATTSGCGALASYFRHHRRHYILPPSANTTQAATYANFANNPITTSNIVALLSTFCSSTNYNVTTSSNPEAGGTTTGGGTYASGANVTVTATVNSGYSFVKWTENGNQVSTTASYTFSNTANRNLVANFTLNTTLSYNVITTSNPVAGGTTTGGGTYASGTNVTVRATANSGYSFARWTENGTQVSTSASHSFTIGANRNLVANFNQNQQYNCGVPTNLTATNITGTTAVISWSYATAPSFRMGYRQVGSKSFTYMTFSPATGVFSYQLTGLKRNTSYEVSLQSVCSTGSSAFSLPVKFTTTSATASPFFNRDNFMKDSPGFGVFPNPSTGRITIETPWAGELTIWNSAGQEILRKILNADRNEIEIKVNGVYMLMFKDQEGNITSKKVKIRK